MKKHLLLGLLFSCFIANTLLAQVLPPNASHAAKKAVEDTVKTDNSDNIYCVAHALPLSLVFGPSKAKVGGSIGYNVHWYQRNHWLSYAAGVSYGFYTNAPDWGFSAEGAILAGDNLNCQNVEIGLRFSQYTENIVYSLPYGSYQEKVDIAQLRPYIAYRYEYELPKRKEHNMSVGFLFRPSFSPLRFLLSAPDGYVSLEKFPETSWNFAFSGGILFHFQNNNHETIN